MAYEAPTADTLTSLPTVLPLGHRAQPLWPYFPPVGHPELIPASGPLHEMYCWPGMVFPLQILAETYLS